MEKTMSIFTDLYKKKSPYLMLETRHFFALWNTFPVTPGHTLVVPKREINILPLLNQDEWEALLPTILKVMKMIESADKKTFYEEMLNDPFAQRSDTMVKDVLNSVGIDKKPDGYNHGVNNGEVAGQTVEHLHWHVIPRYKGDVEDPIGGILNVIPGKGNYRKLMNESDGETE